MARTADWRERIEALYHDAPGRLVSPSSQRSTNSSFPARFRKPRFGRGEFRVP
jgi:hypothetical protein